MTADKLSSVMINNLELKLRFFLEKQFD